MKLLKPIQNTYRTFCTRAFLAMTMLLSHTAMAQSWGGHQDPDVVANQIVNAATGAVRGVFWKAMIFSLFFAALGVALLIFCIKTLKKKKQTKESGQENTAIIVLLVLGAVAGGLVTLYGVISLLGMMFFSSFF